MFLNHFLIFPSFTFRPFNGQANRTSRLVNFFFERKSKPITFKIKEFPLLCGHVGPSKTDSKKKMYYAVNPTSCFWTERQKVFVCFYLSTINNGKICMDFSSRAQCYLYSAIGFGLQIFLLIVDRLQWITSIKRGKKLIGCGVGRWFFEDLINCRDVSFNPFKFYCLIPTNRFF